MKQTIPTNKKPTQKKTTADQIKDPQQREAFERSLAYYKSPSKIDAMLSQESDVFVRFLKIHRPLTDQLTDREFSALVDILKAF